MEGGEGDGGRGGDGTGGGVGASDWGGGAGASDGGGSTAAEQTCIACREGVFKQRTMHRHAPRHPLPANRPLFTSRNRHVVAT